MQQLPGLVLIFLLFLGFFCFFCLFVFFKRLAIYSMKSIKTNNNQNLVSIISSVTCYFWLKLINISLLRVNEWSSTYSNTELLLLGMDWVIFETTSKTSSASENKKGFSYQQATIFSRRQVIIKKSPKNPKPNKPKTTNSD